MPLRPIEIFRLLRPTQWIKNGFVCVGWLFGAREHDAVLLQTVALAVVAFSLVSSAVYAFNDYRDREADRAHPTKKLRPIASGAVTPLQGLVAAAVCAILGGLAAWAADPRVAFIVGLYVAINIAYSAGLKHEPVVDVFCIAAGFMLRIMAGTWGVHIPPSGWLILTAMFLTLFLGFAKRRAEWIDAQGSSKARRTLASYSQPLVDTFLAITATGAVLSYGLYTLDAKTIELHHTDKLIYTLPFVLFGLFRYLYLLHVRNKGENPSVDVFTDGQLAMCGMAFTATAAWLVLR
jgi:4-hydroxybenzoate polyprenyltransferase